MASGFQAWDASGNITLDLSYRVAKFLGSVTVGASYTGTSNSGTVTDTNFTAYSGTVAFAYAMNPSNVSTGDPATSGPAITVSVSGNVLTWTFPYGSYGSGYRPNTVIIYGIR